MVLPRRGYKKVTTSRYSYHGQSIPQTIEQYNRVASFGHYEQCKTIKDVYKTLGTHPTFHALQQAVRWCPKNGNALCCLFVQSIHLTCAKSDHTKKTSKAMSRTVAFDVATGKDIPVDDPARTCKKLVKKDR